MRLKVWLLVLKPVLGKVRHGLNIFLSVTFSVSILSYADAGEGDEDEVETLCKLAQVHLLHLLQYIRSQSPHIHTIFSISIYIW